jgi:hypothetical protein
MEAFNQDELGLFDDWEPAIWSEMDLSSVEDGAFHAEVHDKMAIESPTTPINQRSARIHLPSDSPSSATIKSNELYEYNSSGNKITRAGATKPPRGHDKFAERLPDSLDELQDIGLLNGGKGFGGLQNSSNGISAPQLSSNLHWEYKNWHPGMGAMNTQQKMNEEIKKDKTSMYNDFEITNLP